MKIEIESVGYAMEPLEEIFVSTTLGAAVCRYDREVLHARIAFWPSTASASKEVRCSIELSTERGLVLLEGAGSSGRAAFMRASERIDRALFNHLYGSGAENDARVPEPVAEQRVAA